jgi:hypothetical protein
VGASACSLSEHEESLRKKWRVGATYAFTSTAIRFTGGATFDETRHTVLATLDYQPTRRWTLELGAGPLVGGSLERGGVSFDFNPGLVTDLGASFRLLDADAARPFVVFTGQIAYATGTTHESGTSTNIAYNAFDLRLGAIAGWTLWNVLNPYVVVRAFGGPVYWTYQGDSVTGTDTHHYQVGAGLLALLARRFDIYVEGIPLGEQAVSAGVGVAF